MESLDRSKAVTDLGKRLVTELNLGDDLLAQWMAHVIAERMDAAERASPEARASAQDACARAIFSLWERRNSLPPHMRPFRELEPLLRTLASLDVDSGSRFRYFRRHPSDEVLEGPGVEENRFLDAAVNLDYSARALIQYLLSAAAQEAAEKAIPWIDAAIDAEADAALELRIVEFVSGDTKSPSADGVERKALLDKIEKLEIFSQLARSVAAELRSQLAIPIGDENA
ncbi:conserved protein of unknown function [Burkholderia multivorans]